MVGDEHRSVRGGIQCDGCERVADQKTFNAALGLFRDRAGERERGTARETDTLAVVFAED
jgi:hypothetical protein